VFDILGDDQYASPLFTALIDLLRVRGVGLG